MSSVDNAAFDAADLDSSDATDVGIWCRNCDDGTVLRVKDTFETHTGALHTEVRCRKCDAAGCQTANPPGQAAIRERGAALNEGGRW